MQVNIVLERRKTINVVEAILSWSSMKLLNESQKLSTSKVYQLISDTITEFPFERMVTYFCKRLNVSRLDYYSYLKASDARAVGEQKYLEARNLILKAFNHRGYKKGSRSIKMTLEHDFQCVMSRKKIQRILRKYEIECPHHKPNPYKQMAKVTKEHGLNQCHAVETVGTMRHRNRFFLAF
ncbi:transposase [Metasolibacillus meyeri]|uniref:Transposase n=1 Tax=Metasolibacillus meyeri TaxID=1071052 RepID=A0AAW9NWS3_9BACL|nr:transposase [Metasolibacillus meyeri]MEC1179516.1 transposase [Metasolibacillus meyeri]